MIVNTGGVASDDIELLMNQGSTYEKNVVPREDVSVTKHGLKIPVDAENYEMFVSRMEKSESDFKRLFSYWDALNGVVAQP